MLLSVRVPKVFWAEVDAITAYIINRCISITLKMKEIWLGHFSNLENLRNL